MKHRLKRTDRTSYYLFTALNIASFELVAPDVITLMAILIGASSILIGAVNSLSFLSFAVVPLGRFFVVAEAPVHSMVIQWRARYVSLLLIVAALALNRSLHHELVIALFFLGLCGFYLGKGFGMAARGPVLGHVSEGNDRGAFISLTQVVNVAVQIVTRLVIVGFLIASSKAGAFIPIVATAVLIGFGGSVFLQRISEPPADQAMPSKRGIRELSSPLHLLRTIRPLVVYIFLWAVFSGMLLPFFVVFLKQVVGLDDDAIVLCVAVGSAGALFAMYGGNRGMDRLGPGFFLGGAALLFTLSILILIAYTSAHVPVSGLLLGFVVFALFRSGQAVVLAAGDAFLLNQIDPRDRLNGGIFYQVARGAGGIAGSIGGGLIMSGLRHSRSLSLTHQFLLYWFVAFGVVCLYLVAAVFLRRTEQPVSQVRE